MEAVVAISALAGLVWGGVIFLRGGLLGGALCVLLAGTCFSYPMLSIPFAPVPLTADRVLWLVLMVQLFFYWRLGLTERRPINRTELLLLALIGVFGVSIVTHDWTANHNLPLSQFLFYYLMPAGMYCVARQTRLTERGIMTMFVLLGAFGVYVAVTAIGERWEINSLVFPRYISSPDFAYFLGRARGPLLNPAGNGILLGMCLGAGLMAWPRVNRPGKLLLIAYSALLSLGVYCTLTRSAWMGTALGLLVLCFLALPRLYRPWFCVAAALGIAAFFATQWENIVEYKRDRYVPSRETAVSAEARPILAAIAWEMFVDRPIFGCGFGHYADEHVNYLANRNIDLPLEHGRTYAQHNTWLAILTETGLIGLTLVVIIQLSWLRSAWRLWRAEQSPLWMRQQGLLFFVVAAGYFVNGMFQDVVIITMANMYLFFMAGITTNLLARADEMEDRLALLASPGARR